MNTLRAHQSVPFFSAHPFPRPVLLALLALLVIDVALFVQHGTLDTCLWQRSAWLFGDSDKTAELRLRDGATGDLPRPSWPWYLRNPRPLEGRLYHITERWWLIFRDFGEPDFTAVLCLLLWSLKAQGKRPAWKIPVTLVISTSAAGAAGAVLRLITGRFRPVSPSALNGQSVWAVFRGFHDGHDLSFPSGHATLAFSTAATLGYFFPRGKWLFILLACGTALSRVVMLAHFPSDALTGAWIGYAVGWLVTTWLDWKVGRRPEV